MATYRTEDAPSPYIGALHAIYSPLSPYAMTLLRVALGAYLMLHGYPKVFEGGTVGLAGLLTKLGLPMPIVWANVVAAVEFGGGALLVLGLFTRFAALAAMIEFAFIVFVIKFANGFFAFAPKAIQPGFPAAIPGGYELELLLGLMCFAFLLAGGGRLSLDHSIGREL